MRNSGLPPFLGSSIEADMTAGSAPRTDAADQTLVASLSVEFRSALRRYFLRRRLSESDAEDAVQEVFVRLSRRRGLAEMENVAGYLFETAASVAIDHQRRPSQRHAWTHQSYDEAIHAVGDYGPDRVLEGREDLKRVLAGLLELPERTRQVFVLARLERMRHAEIGRRIGISVSAVEKHIIKAHAHLALRLEMGR